MIALLVLMLLPQTPAKPINEPAWIQVSIRTAPDSVAANTWTTMVGPVICEIYVDQRYHVDFKTGQKSYGTWTEIKLMQLGQTIQPVLVAQIFEGKVEFNNKDGFKHFCGPAIPHLPPEVTKLAPDYFKLTDK